MIKAPFSYFGGKSRIAKVVWSALGDVSNYVEPFAGSLAVLLANPKIPKLETVNDKDCMICIGPETRILKSDLTWEYAKNLSIGDRLLAFDEENFDSERRKWRQSVVLQIPRVCLPCYELTFNDGTKIIASENHCWLTILHCEGKKGRELRWVSTKNLIVNKGDTCSWILKLAPVLSKENSKESRLLNEALNNKAFFRRDNVSNILISQDSDVLEKILKERDFDFVLKKEDGVFHFNINGGVKEHLRLLMTCRPKKFINDYISRIENFSISKISCEKQNNLSIVTKKYIGIREVIALSTSTKTFIAEGLASHNCNFWRAVSKDPEGVAKFADYPVIEADLHARQRWLLSKVDDEFIKKFDMDADFYDVQVAGYWVWGMGASIGNNWLNTKGLNSKPLLSYCGGGIHALSNNILDWFQQIQQRTRRTRVCCGDWKRIVTPLVTYKNLALGKNDITGVFLDPPYNTKNRDKVYKEDENIFNDVSNWAIENGENPKLRIVLCGYDGDFDFPNTWSKYNWKSSGLCNLGDSRGRKNASKEAIWFNKYCLPIDEFI